MLGETLQIHQARQQVAGSAEFLVLLHQVSDLIEYWGYRFLEESRVLHIRKEERDELERINDDCIEYGPDRVLLQVFNE